MVAQRRGNSSLRSSLPRNTLASLAHLVASSSSARSGGGGRLHTTAPSAGWETSIGLIAAAEAAGGHDCSGLIAAALVTARRTSAVRLITTESVGDDARAI